MRSSDPYLTSFWFEPVLLAGALQARQPLHVVQFLHKHQLVSNEGVFSRLTTVQWEERCWRDNTVEELLLAWKWIATHTPDNNLPLGIWFALIRILVYHQWPASDLDHFCRTGLEDTTLFDAARLSETSGRYEDVPGLLDQMQRWARDAENKNVEDWVVLQVAHGGA